MEEVIQVLSKFYKRIVRISQVTDIVLLTRGKINRTYKIEGVTDDFPIIFRKYNSAKTVSDIEFEHRIMHYLQESDSFKYSGSVIPTDDGMTFVTEKAKDAIHGFYAVFEYLPGDDRYTLTENNLTLIECQSFATVFTQLHVVLSLFPDAFVLRKPRVNDQIPMMIDKLSIPHQAFSLLAIGPEAPKHNSFRDIWLSNETIFAEEFGFVAQASERQKGIPEMLIWKDGHGGNVKWAPTQETVQHVFDFDWSTKDSRLFDLAFTLSALSSILEKNSKCGSFDFQKFKTVLEFYLSGLKDNKTSRISFLTDAELDSLEIEIRKINLYLLDWVHTDYFQKCKSDLNFDPTYHVEYLDHVCKSVLWIQDTTNQSILNDVIHEV